MTALKQALKALDPHQFELLIFHLLKEQYPGVDLKHIEGSGGDQGLDIISGQLDDRPTIWQCKAFANAVKDAQKRQIKDSLNQALRHHTPPRWVLCLNTDMDPKAFRWFQRLAASHAKNIHVELQQGSDIVHQLLYRNTLLERFFPNIALNTAMIREGLAGTNLFSLPELSALNEQNVTSYLARLQAHDARFAYAITYNRDRQPTLEAASGELLTLTTGDTTLHVYARDHHALKLHPPRGTFTLSGAGIEKFMDHLRTGSPQILEAGEVTAFTSDFDFLRPSKQQTGISLRLEPKAVGETLPLRLKLGVGEEAATYEYISFKCTQVGTDEGTFESTGKLPFRMTIVLRSDGTGTVNFLDMSEGNDVHDVQKFVRGIAAAVTSGIIDLYDLTQGKTFISPTLDGPLPLWWSRYTALIDDAVGVADRYKRPLVVKGAPSETDVKALDILKRLPDGISLPLGEIRLGVDKVADLPPEVRQRSRDEHSFRLTAPTFLLPLRVFGTDIPTGPIQYDIRGCFKDPDALMDSFAKAAIGARLEIILDSREVIARSVKSG